MISRRMRYFHTRYAVHGRYSYHDDERVRRPERYAERPKGGITLLVPRTRRSSSRENNEHLVGVVEFQSRIDVPGIYGLDLFLQTDLLLAFRRGETVLEW